MSVAANHTVSLLVQPPTLDRIDQPALIKFETDYAAYLAKVEDLNKDQEEDAKLTPASIKDCIDGQTLHALCMLGQIDGAETIEEATVDKVKAWFEAASAVAPKDLSERIDSAVSATKFKINKQSPSGAVHNYLLDFVKSLDQHNASEIFKDSDLSKKVID